MKRKSLETIIENCYSKGMTWEANQLTSLLGQLDLINPAVTLGKSTILLTTQAVKTGGIRQGVLEKIYQNNLSLDTALDTISVLEDN